MGFIVSKKIKDAIANKKGIVALESTIITHGMPYPSNVETALKVEKTIIENNAVPATIGVLNGDIIVGLDNKQIDELGKNKNSIKLSKRDLPIAVANKFSGGTTVSGTMICAQKAGIEIFATGGIGGVHRKAEKTFDISRDLFELGETNVSVICSGAKAILDIDKTLEVLESQGVSVISYLEKSFANFYCHSTNNPVDFTFDSPLEAAKIIKAKRDLNLSGGILISNPCPEEYALSHEYVDKIISEALKKADEKNVRGKDITPFLLSYILELTGGKSLKTNIHLVLNNAKLAALIANEYVKL